MDISGFNMDVPEIDPNFEPQFRSRSNTWPLRPKEFIKEEPDNVSTPSPTSTDEQAAIEVQPDRDPLGLNNKKSGSRRNAWGNLSYADLITKAIQTSAEQRLTLSQIYDWMVQNVPYFKDKGDSNSSAGWKNSIRHNLSLHNRFMRIQNEGTGKSSWWVINPDAKPGKTPRRRATSMDTKAYEKKRGRVKKKVEQMRAALEGLGSNPASEYGDSTGELSHLAESSFSLSPQDFRARTSSNASSIGRLSPIHAGLEPELQDVAAAAAAAPMSPWSQAPPGAGYQNQDTLSESLAEMFVGDALSPNNVAGSSDLLVGQLSAGSPLQSLSPVNYQDQGGYLPAPPPYPMGAGGVQPTRQPVIVGKNGLMAGSTSPQDTYKLAALASPLCGGGVNNGLQGFMVRPAVHSLSELLQQDPSAYRPSAEPYMPAVCQYNAFPTASPATSSLEQLELSNSLLRQALGQKQMSGRPASAGQLSPPPALGPVGQGRASPNVPLTAGLQRSGADIGMMRSSIQQQLMNGGTMQTAMMSGTVVIGPQGGMPTDLDVAYSDMSASEIECDVDQIIKHELSMDGNLDFIFDGSVVDSSQCNGMTTLTL